MAKTSDVLTAILVGGLVAGTLDIGAAVLISGKGPGTILQFIAMGVLGKASMQGGTGSMVLGLALQWAMSLIIAAIFVLASVRLPILRRQWLIAGLAYGVPVFCVMEFVVVPLSAIQHMPHFTTLSLAKNLAAMMAFGLIIAAAARWRLGAART